MNVATRTTVSEERNQTSLVLSPEQLAEFGKVDSALPALVIENRNAELQREYRYAMGSLAGGVLVTFGILGSFVYLVMSGHPQAAAGLLGVGVLSLVGGFLRSRL
jgi:predicted benzoate:H+ symporter BenE